MYSKKTLIRMVTELTYELDKLYDNTYNIIDNDNALYFVDADEYERVKRDALDAMLCAQIKLSNFKEYIKRLKVKEEYKGMFDSADKKAEKDITEAD